jgi:hypothetical protein
MRIHRRPVMPGTETDVMAREPRLDFAMRLCVDAWFDLGTERSIGFGACGPIPASQVRAWAKDRGLDGDLSRALQRVIRSLDITYLDRQASKGKST